MRVLVCGGRDFGKHPMDTHRMDEALSILHGEVRITELIHGAARGADNMAAHWAAQEGIPRRAFPADWAKHGRAAGPIRNKQMLDEGRPDLVLAFPGGRGTENMVKQATQAGVEVRRVGH